MAVLQTEIIKLASNGEDAFGFLARPDNTSTFPGLVLIQEWWGIKPHVRELAQLAGYHRLCGLSARPVSRQDCY